MGISSIIQPFFDHWLFRLFYFFFLIIINKTSVGTLVQESRSPLLLFL